MKKNLWSLLIAIMTISLSAIAFAACGDGDNDETTGDNNENNGGNTEIKNDYTATTNVKTVTLKECHGSANFGNVTVYEDFNYKYNLELYLGDMGLIPYKREDGTWQEQANYHWSSKDSYKNINIKDLGKLSSISDVNEKLEIDSYIYLPAAQPGHGYATCFLTDDGTKHLRLYISDYKLDNKGSLENITVQYQLY